MESVLYKALGQEITYDKNACFSFKYCCQFGNYLMRLHLEINALKIFENFRLNLGKS